MEICRLVERANTRVASFQKDLVVRDSEWDNAQIVINPSTTRIPSRLTPSTRYPDSKSWTRS
jgi:hypothetical protein